MRGGYEIALFCPILVATATDLLWGKIFNWLTFPFLLTGLIARLVLGGFADLSQGLIAIAIAFALFFPLYVVRAIAAGDAKLLMAMAAWTDSRTIIEVAAIAIVIGAAVGLISLLRQKGFRGSVQSVAENVAQGSAHGQLAEDALWTRILVRVLGGEYRPVSALGAFVKRGKRRLGNERGQTTLEYMLLLATTFIVSYLVITGPMSQFTRLMLVTIRSALINVVQNGELTPGSVLQPGQAGHPGDPIRTKALHNSVQM